MQKSADKEQQPTEAQNHWFLALKVIMLTFCIPGLIFGFYNVYKFLYRQGKYKEPINVIVYIAAILCLLLNVAYTMLTPITDFCNLDWFLTSYLAAYCDLMVGICQCYLLSMLSQQLTCLWTFQVESAKVDASTFVLPKNQGASILMSQSQISKSIQEIKMLIYRQYQKRMCMIKSLFSVMFLSNVFMFCIHLYYVIDIIQEYEGEDCQMKKVEDIYHYLRLGFMVIVLVVLIYTTYLLLYQIQKNSQRENFRKELINTAIAFWSFVLMYTGWLIFYVYELLAPYHEVPFKDQILTIGVSGFLFSVLPILMLFFIHFQSYTSIRNLFTISSNKNLPTLSSDSQDHSVDNISDLLVIPVDNQHILKSVKSSFSNESTTTRLLLAIDNNPRESADLASEISNYPQMEGQSLKHHYMKGFLNVMVQEGLQQECQNNQDIAFEGMLDLMARKRDSLEIFVQ